MAIPPRRSYIPPRPKCPIAKQNMFDITWELVVEHVEGSKEYNHRNNVLRELIVWSDGSQEFRMNGETDEIRLPLVIVDNFYIPPRN